MIDVSFSWLFVEDYVIKDQYMELDVWMYPDMLKNSTLSAKTPTL